MKKKTTVPREVTDALSGGSATQFIELLQALEELAIAFQDKVQEPLGFFEAFVQAKHVLRTHGRELPTRKAGGR